MSSKKYNLLVAPFVAGTGLFAIADGKTYGWVLLAIGIINWTIGVLSND